MTASAPVRTNGHRRRAAGFYIMVLGVSMMLMTLGLSALMAVRIQRRGAEGGNDLNAASLYAQSAIDLGMHWIENDPTWRTSLGEGTWTVNQPIGGGSLTLQANDLGSNNLLEASADTDSVLLTGIGFKGDARYKLQVTLQAELLPLTCLEVVLHANNDVIFSGATVTCDQTISANNNVAETSSTVDSNIEAVNSISGTFNGTTTTGITPRTMPDAATVFDYYVTNGTPITVSGLSIDGVLLSPSSNPYGAATNPEGIYVVDCLGANFTIRNSRIVGTIVLLNAGSGSEVRPSVNLAPAVANLPVLLVQGSVKINTGSGTLNESAVNFNPAGTPYQGVADTDVDDSYPPIINGLVYVSGNLQMNNNAIFDGVVVVGNTCTGGNNIGLTYDATFHANPPPGFRAPVQMVVSPASWRQVVD